MFNFYGLFISLGLLAGCLVVEGLRKSSQSRDLILTMSIFDLLPWLLIPGVIGARLYHVIDYWNYYAQKPRLIFYLWRGGLGIFGAIIGGLAGLIFFSALVSWKQLRTEKAEQISNWSLKRIIFQLFNNAASQFLAAGDLIAIGLPLGQAIGRWGNYFNQELYGWPTSLPWGIYILPENRLPGFEGFERFQPLFLYESFGCLLIFILLVVFFFSKANYKKGFFFFSYLFLYSFLRFWLEFLRIESWRWQGIRVNQLVSLILALLSLLAILKKSAKIKKIKNNN